MKKRTFSALLALLAALALLPVSALAAPSDADLRTAPTISKLEIRNDGASNVWLELTVQTPANVRSAVDYFENHEKGYNQAGYIGGIELDVAIDGGEWTSVGTVSLSPNYEQDTDDPWNGIFETEYLSELHVSSGVRARARYTGADADGDVRTSDWSNILSLNEAADFTAHDWALSELAEADALGLIPASLKGEDLTKPISRAEFAAVSVRVYESLTGTQAQPAAKDPFTDTDDPEVLKALNVGVTNGTSGTTFSPNVLLDREQAATMLTRVYKKVALDGWTLETDGSFNAQFKGMFTAPAAFADDSRISPWAKDSVYFMVANGIIKGTGDNEFAPRAVTSAEQAAGYAQATREQALLIATRMVQNLK